MKDVSMSLISTEIKSIFKKEISMFLLPLLKKQTPQQRPLSILCL